MTFKNANILKDVAHVCHLMANMFIGGEKLSFKDKMKLFAMQSGDHLADNAENKFKNSKKQRKIESKFEIK